ncbi:ImmA/IrrE family metallo-endopeptidase [Micromonospora chalcea]|uniref:ImmA/IrrE family metallo-endopeptidase n=1 Tax=Micromonospora chalcea TaxID=1874 RepID=UPI00340825DB
MTTTWTALAGNTSSFAIAISFATDLEDHHYDSDERESWGSLTVWVNGVNVTEHSEQGEILRETHWYLLPTLEWFVANWDALLHEERLPLRNAGADAAGAMTRLLIQPLRLVRPDLGEFERLEKWQGWWSRHNITDSSEGGIFPDLYIRRWGDLAEISVGSTRPAGTPSHFHYQNVNVVGRVPVNLVASSLHDVLVRASDELLRRRPDSERFRRLKESVLDLLDPDAQRYATRLAFLSGVDATSSAALADFISLWERVDEGLGPDLSADARELAVGRQRGGLILETAPQVALLFGSYSPTIDENDVQVLVRNLHKVLRERRAIRVPDVKRPDLPMLPPGQEGSQLGEAAFRELADPSANFVDISAILDNLGITYSVDSLSDTNTRAVTLLAEEYGIHIVVNASYSRGNSERILRFTLAHELGHILFDRTRASRMTTVSGPWAPLAIEQRANAFAAALLIPEELVDRLLRQLNLQLPNPRAAQLLASHLRVSLSSLADRLYNLMLLSREEADNLVYSRRD